MKITQKLFVAVGLALPLASFAEVPEIKCFIDVYKLDAEGKEIEKSRDWRSQITLKEGEQTFSAGNASFTSNLSGICVPNSNCDYSYQFTLTLKSGKSVVITTKNISPASDHERTFLNLSTEDTQATLTCDQGF